VVISPITTDLNDAVEKYHLRWYSEDTEAVTQGGCADTN
jgi:hypothetical protein